MKSDDKILFERAKTRIEASRLDDHSKEGISVALAMSGEACNGMSDAEKLQTLTRAVFSMTLAVSYFMAQAPDHTLKCVNEAIDGHVNACVKRIVAQSNQECDDSELNFTLFGNKVASKGRAATVISVILSAITAIIIIIGGMFYYLNKSDRDAWKKEMRSELMNISENQAIN